MLFGLAPTGAAAANGIGATNVQLRQPVSAITVGEGGVVVTAGATKHEADYAVLAVPPLTWNRIAFTPLRLG